MFTPLLLVGVLLSSDGSTSSTAQLDPTDLGIPFQRYTTTDALGRTITFYLSRASGAANDTKLPVVLLIQGSGRQSLWRKRGDQIVGGQQNLLRNAANARARVLVVEKPGVNFSDEAQRPGSADGASEQFLEEHTLSRWAEANRAALASAWTLPNIDRSRSLVIGHSEGGIVAARLAADMSEITHVASLAGGGPNQLFSLAESRGQARPEDQPGDAAKRMQSIYDGWSEVQKDPESISKFWLGHPYRRWSSFLKSSTLAELSKSKARVFLAQGGRDTSVPPAAHDVLVAELRAAGRDVTAERIDDADHGFRTPDLLPGSPAGMQALFGRVVDWFLQN